MNLRILLLTNNAEVVDRRIVTQHKLDSNSMCFYVIYIEMKSVTIQTKVFKNSRTIYEEILCVLNSTIHI